jgi:hypothetical protein
MWGNNDEQGWDSLQDVIWKGEGGGERRGRRSGRFPGGDRQPGWAEHI